MGVLLCILVTAVLKIGMNIKKIYAEMNQICCRLVPNKQKSLLDKTKHCFCSNLTDPG